MKNLQSGLLYSLTGAAAVASLASCSAQKKAEEQKQYNIVYIMTDDHTAQMMSCYDHRYMETPNLDRIAADGVRFTNSFVANSLSGPSRACMITGKHSCANKFYDNTTCVFDASQQTFPKLLQQAGYETAVRLGISVALTTLIAAETTGATAGLGMRIRSLANSFETAGMLMYIIIIGIIGLVMEKIIKFLEGRLTGWQEKRE